LRGIKLTSRDYLAIRLYTNASWTIKIGLLSEHFCRLLAHMDARGYDVATPAPADPGMRARPFTDNGSGYIRRSLDQLPRQGSRPPWRISPTYGADVKLLRRGHVDDPELRFERAKETVPASGEGDIPRLSLGHG
jgi:hypothetical protein